MNESFSTQRKHPSFFPSEFAATLLALGLSVFPAVAAGAATTSLRVVSGGDQQTTYMSTFAKPLKVWVCDSVTQHSVPGVRVNFTPGAGIRLSEPFAVTDNFGLASVIATGIVVGESSVVAEIAGSSNTAVTFADLVVGKAVLTVVPVDQQSTVGEIPPITEYTIQGFVNGDNEDTAQISGVPVLSTIANESSPDANYAIKGDVGTLSAPNYMFKAGFGALVLRGTGRSDPSAGDGARAGRVDAPGTGGGLPVVQRAIQATGTAAPVMARPGTVRGATIFRTTDIARPTALPAGSVRQAVRGPVVAQPVEAPSAVVRPSAFGEPFTAVTKAGAKSPSSGLAVRSAMPGTAATSAVVPDTQKSLKIRKAFNPPTPN